MDEVLTYPKRVLVLGGYGLIGLPIVRRLLDDGYEVMALARDSEFGMQVEPRAMWLGTDIAKRLDSDTWTMFTDGCDVVVNASGALQTGLRDNLRALHYDAILALVKACEKTRTRIVQISAPGADPFSKLEFLRTKGFGDNCVRGLSHGWVILKPGVVISHSAYGGTALLRMLASFPLVTPLVLPNARMQTVAISDVVEAVVMAVDGRIPAGTDIDVVEPTPHSLEEVALSFRHWLGIDRKPVVRLPGWAGNLIGKCADGLGWLGWRSPLRSTALGVLKDDVLANGDDFARYAGRPALCLDETLRSIPSSIQERWFSQLSLVAPVLVATLSLFWLTSGVIALFELEAATAHLLSIGLSWVPSISIVVLGALLDILLGAAILWKRWSRPACFGMIAVTVAYLFMGSLLDPALWIDPIGPYVKTIPAAVLAWVASYLVKTR